MAVTLRDIEEASLRAWPAIEETHFEGWTLRCSEGFTSRANSVQALGTSTRALEEPVGYCERWYEARGQPCLFRLSPLVEPGLEQFLAKRGYDRSDRTLVLHRRARGLDPRRAGLDVRDNGLYDWLRAYAQFTGAPAAPAPMARIIERMGGGALLGTLWGADPRRAVACGLAVVDGALLGLFDLVVAPDYRRRGFGTELVRRLATWGMVGGATDVYLQVTEANVPALGLYGSLGFREAYDYWYRIRCS